jgi:spore coat protein CotH
MSRSLIRHSLCICLLPLLLTPATAHAQTASDFFDSNTLQELQLFIHSRDFQDLRERYWEDRYYPADFLWRGIRVRNVGVRIRGLATRSAIKPGLRVDFNRYIEGQAFLGLHALVLDNELKDPALIRERTSMAFITRMGQPASRESFGRLYINGIYHGVYGFVEAVDADFLTRTLGENTGYLFDYKFITPFFAEDLGDNLDAYKPRFEPHTHRLESDPILYSPIRDLFREVNHDVDAVWRERVGQYLDLEQLVTHVAIERFLAEDDGFLGYAGMANFYLYRPAGRDTHRLLAWDRDSTFFQIDSPIFQRVEDNVLMRRALSFPDLWLLYLDVLERCARSAAENGWLENEIVRISAVVRNSAYEDTLKQFSNEEYDQAVAFLVEFARRRSGYVLEEVRKARLVMTAIAR